MREILVPCIVDGVCGEHRRFSCVKFLLLLLNRGEPWAHRVRMSCLPRSLRASGDWLTLPTTIGGHGTPARPTCFGASTRHCGKKSTTTRHKNKPNERTHPRTPEAANRQNSISTPLTTGTKTDHDPLEPLGTHHHTATSSNSATTPPHPQINPKRRKTIYFPVDTWTAQISLPPTICIETDDDPPESLGTHHHTATSNTSTTTLPTTQNGQERDTYQTTSG